MNRHRGTVVIVLCTLLPGCFHAASPLIDTRSDIRPSESLGDAEFKVSITNSTPLILRTPVSLNLTHDPVQPLLSKNRTLTLAWSLESDSPTAVTIVEFFLNTSAGMKREFKVPNLGAGRSTDTINMDVGPASGAPTIGIVAATSSSKPVNITFHGSSTSLPIVELPVTPLSGAKVGAVRLLSEHAFVEGFRLTDDRTNVSGDVHGPGRLAANLEWTGPPGSLVDFDFTLFASGEGSWSADASLGDHAFHQAGVYGATGLGGSGFTEGTFPSANVTLALDNTLSSGLRLEAYVLAVPLPTDWRVVSEETSFTSPA